MYHESHHQIVFGIVNLPVPRAPTYKRAVWKYDKTDIGMINLELSSTNWSERFHGLDVDQAVDSFTNCFRDEDAPWITDEVKKPIKRKHRVYRNTSNEAESLKNGRALNKLKAIQQNHH